MHTPKIRCSIFSTTVHAPYFCFDIIDGTLAFLSLIIPGGLKKKINKTLSYNSDCLAVVTRLLFNALDALWLWHWRKRFVIVVYFKMTPQRDNRVRISALLRAVHKVSEAANLAGVSRITVYAIKKCMDGGEGANRRVGSSGTTVTIYNSLSTTVTKQICSCTFLSRLIETF